MNTQPPPKQTLDSLDRYRLVLGIDKWSSLLARAWDSGNPLTDYPGLRALRNTHGSSWLRSYAHGRNDVLSGDRVPNLTGGGFRAYALGVEAENRFKGVYSETLASPPLTLGVHTGFCREIADLECLTDAPGRHYISITDSGEVDTCVLGGPDHFRFAGPRRYFRIRPEVLVDDLRASIEVGEVGVALRAYLVLMTHDAIDAVNGALLGVGLRDVWSPGDWLEGAGLGGVREVSSVVLEALSDAFKGEAREVGAVRTACLSSVLTQLDASV